MKHPPFFLKLSDLTVLLIYFIIIFAFLYPLSLHPGKYILNTRFFDTEYFLSCQISDYVRTLGDFPSKISGIQYPESGYITYVALPLLFTAGLLSLFINTLSAFNLMMMLFLLLNCYFSYLLADYWIKNRQASFIAGLISGFSPFIFSMLYNGNIENLGVTFVPLFILFIMKYLDGGKLVYAFPAALMFAFIFLSSPYYSFAALIFLSIASAFFLSARGINFRNLRFIAVIFIIVLLTTIPCYMYFAYDSRVDPSQLLGHAGVTIVDDFNKTPDIVEPSSVTVLKYFFMIDKAYLYNKLENFNSIHLYYIGWIPLLLIIAGIFVGQNPGKRLWYSALLAFIIVSFGKVLYFDKTTPLMITGSLPLYMPFYLLLKLTTLSYKLKNLYRLTYMVYLFSGIITAYAVSVLIRDYKSFKKTAVIIMACLLILAEFTVLLYGPLKLDIAEYEIPEIYKIISQDKGDYAIIDFPGSFIGWPNIPKGLVYKTVHGKKTTSSIGGDIPDLASAMPLIRNAIFVSLKSDMNSYMDNQMLRRGRNDTNTKFMENIIRNSFTEDKDVLSSVGTLRAYGFKYLIMHDYCYPDKERLDAAKAYLNRYLKELKYYPRDRITVYSI